MGSRTAGGASARPMAAGPVVVKATGTIFRGAPPLVKAPETHARDRGSPIVETWTFHGSPLSLPFWTERMGYAERSVNLRKQLN